MLATGGLLPEGQLVISREDGYSHKLKRGWQGLVQPQGVQLGSLSHLETVEVHDNGPILHAG